MVTIWENVAHRGGALTVAYSADGQQLVSSGVDGVISISRAATGLLCYNVSLRATIGNDGVDIICARLSSDGSRAIYGTTSSQVGVVSVPGGTTLAMRTLTSLITAMDVSDDLSLVAVGCANGELELWDGLISKRWKAVLLEGAAVTAVRIVREGGWVLCGTRSGSVYFVDLQDGSVVTQRKTHSSYVVSVDGTQGRDVLSCGADNMLCWWGGGSGTRRYPIVYDGLAVLCADVARKPELIVVGLGSGDFMSDNPRHVIARWHYSKCAETVGILDVSERVMSLQWRRDFDELCYALRNGRIGVVKGV